MGTHGYRAVLNLVREDDIKHDPHGTSMGWLFCIADVMHADADDIMPGYRPSPVRERTREDVIEDNPYADTIFDMIDSGGLTHDDLRAAYAILDRFNDWVRLAGKDY